MALRLVRHPFALGLVWGFAALAPLVRAQQAPAPPGEVVIEAHEGTELPAEVLTRDAVPEKPGEPQGLLRLLTEKMTGQRVIAIGDPNYHHYTSLGPEYDRATTQVERLQVIAATQDERMKSTSEGNALLIPFKVGSSYVLAPDKRQEVDTDLEESEVVGRGPLLMEALLRLNARQLAQVGSEQGMAVTSLPEESRALLMRAFRPPLTIRNVRESFSSDEEMTEPDNNSEIDEVLDWSRVRIRANLKLTGMQVPLQGGRRNYIYVGDTDDSGTVIQAREDGRMNFDFFGNAITFHWVDNTYKPSDIEGRHFTQPLGLQGIHPVKEVVKRLAAATRLHLLPGVFADLPMFIGSPVVTVGEVMDALRLANSGSWRRLGDMYLLAVDNQPRQAIELWAQEVTEALAKRSRSRMVSINEDPNWLQVLTNLRFDPHDTMALSQEQQAKVFPREPRAWLDRKSTSGVTFHDLTPDQQALVRERAAQQSETMVGPDGETIPVTEADVMQGQMEPDGRVTVSLQLPGMGWARTDGSWNHMEFNRWKLRAAARNADPSLVVDPLEEAPPEVRSMLESAEPMEMRSAVRGAVVPALGPARLEELADEMKRHGLNVLYYPALFGGYATFPAKSFPLHPAMRGQDGYAAAVKAMQARGINVVAYWNTLAWQNASEPVHWLDKHPEWQDRDALGRTRLEWAAKYPDKMDQSEVLGIPASNFVRPTEPAVVARLEAFLGECAARKDITSIAFAEFKPGSSGSVVPFVTAPRLGFSVTDRIRELRATGLDPADGDENGQALMRRPVPPMPGAPAEKPRPDVYVDTVNRLLVSAKRLRKDWKTCVLDGRTFEMGRPLESGAPKKLPADLVIQSIFRLMESPSGLDGVSYPIARRNFLSVIASIEESAARDIPKKFLELPSIVIFNTVFATERTMSSRSVPAILLDVRNAPDQISETLKWVKPPANAKPAPKPGGAPPKRPAGPPPRTGR